MGLRHCYRHGNLIKGDSSEPMRGRKVLLLPQAYRRFQANLPDGAPREPVEGSSGVKEMISEINRPTPKRLCFLPSISDISISRNSDVLSFTFVLYYCSLMNGCKARCFCYVFFVSPLPN